MPIINLGEYLRPEGKVLMGRDAGVAAAKSLKLNTKDKFIFKVPAECYSINTSFFLGCFGPIVREFGSKENFFQNIAFICSPEIDKDIEYGISRALTESV